MRVNYLKAQNFRNINDIEIDPCENVNIIYGENAQGKTNLLESIWLFTGFRSFRGSKEQEFIKFGSDYSKLNLGFFGNDREQAATLLINEKRNAQLNEVSLSSASKLVGEFLAVVFSPINLTLIKEGPCERRKFLDTALCQLKPSYANNLSQYNRTLVQRNVLLKDITYHSELYDTLEIWDEKLSIIAANIIFERINYINKLKPVVSDIYTGLSSGREKMTVEYQMQSNFESNDLKSFQQEMFQMLKTGRKADILNGTTGIGPHRDDLKIEIDNLSARNFGSQGQQRSCALSLKLSEAALIKNITGQQPVALLDDVMSELDSARQDYILNHIEGWQVFITCCEPTPLLKMNSGKAFKLKEGHLCTCT